MKTVGKILIGILEAIIVLYAILPLLIVIVLQVVIYIPPPFLTA